MATPVTTGSAEVAVPVGRCLLVRDASGSGRLLDLDGDFHALDPIATGIVVDVGSVGRDEATRALSRRHGIDTERAAADVDALLRSLPAGLTGAGPGPCATDQAAAAVLAGVLRLPSGTVRTVVLLWGARLAFRTLGWTRTIGIIRAATASFPAAVPQAHLLVRTDRTVRRAGARSVLGHTCKERSAAAFTEVRSAGLDAEIVLGAELHPLSTHAWCATGGRVVGDNPDVCAAQLPIARYR